MEPNNYKRFWDRLRKSIVDYKVTHEGPCLENERYCISISCDDLLEKMENIENGK